jgi:hypothetical protein
VGGANSQDSLWSMRRRCRPVALELSVLPQPATGTIISRCALPPSIGFCFFFLSFFLVRKKMECFFQRIFGYYGTHSVVIKLLLLAKLAALRR